MLPSPRRAPAPSKNSAPSGFGGRAPLLLLLIAAAIAPYARTLGFGFVLDDERLVRSLPEIRSLASIPAVLGLTGEIPQPRALRTVSFAIDHAIAGGFDPAVFHATNVLLHALAVFAVWRLAFRIGGPRVALLAALVFAVHPVQTETVAFVTARKDLLATLFATLAFERFLKHREEPTPGRYDAILGFFLLAVLSKEVAVVLPALFLAWDTIVSGDAPVRAVTRRLRFYAPFAALAAIGAATAVALHEISAFAADARFPGNSAIATWLTIPAILARYAGLLLFPLGQSADYSFDAFPLVRSPLEWRFLFPAALLAAVAVGTQRLHRRSPLAAFGLLWTGIALLPVSQIVPHHEIMAEHYLYLPMVGFALAAGIGLEALMERSPAAAPRVVGTMLLLLAALAAIRVRVWADSETLLASVAERSPRCARARFGLGEELARRGRAAEAEAEWTAAVEVGRGATPEESRGYVAAQNRLALAGISRWTAGGRKPADPELERAVGRLRDAMAAAPEEPGPRLNLLTLAVQARRADLVMEATFSPGTATSLSSRAADALLEIGTLPPPPRAADGAALVSRAIRDRSISGETRRTALRLVESFLGSRGDLPSLFAFSRWRGLSAREAFRHVRRSHPTTPEFLPATVLELRRRGEIERPSAVAAGASPEHGAALESLLDFLSKSVLESVRRGPRDRNPDGVAAVSEEVRRALRAWLGDPLPGDREL